MKTAHFLTLLLSVCAWPGASTAQAQSPGTVVAWGPNWAGQTTVPVTAQSGVTAIAAGGAHTVALKNDGSVVAWGRNTEGQTTVPVAAQSGVMAVAAGGAHTVALKNDGSAVAWGDNGEGRSTVPVAAQSGVRAIAAGAYPVRIGTDNDWAVPSSAASELRITGLGVDANGKFWLSFSQPNALSHFILDRGTDLTNLKQPVDAMLGPFVFQLSDPAPVSSNPSAFYRVRAVPFSEPLDVDGDGIDDGYELRHRAFLNPFNPADAALDFDADGRSNLQEYRDGTDPATAP